MKKNMNVAKGNRKQKAMENTHVKMSARGSRMGFPTDTRIAGPSLEYAIRVVTTGINWNSLDSDRDWLQSTFKDGGKMFDQALALLNSPLMKALS